MREAAHIVIQPTNPTQLFGSGQIPSDVCHPEAQAHQGKVYLVRERCRPVLAPQAVPGTVLGQELCVEL